MMSEADPDTLPLCSRIVAHKSVACLPERRGLEEMGPQGNALFPVIRAFSFRPVVGFFIIPPHNKQHAELRRLCD